MVEITETEKHVVFDDDGHSSSSDGEGHDRAEMEVGFDPSFYLHDHDIPKSHPNPAPNCPRSGEIWETSTPLIEGPLPSPFQF